MHASLLKLAVGEISTFWVIEQVVNELYKHFMKTIQERSYTKDDHYLLNNYCFEVYIEGEVTRRCPSCIGNVNVKRDLFRSRYLT